MPSTRMNPVTPARERDGRPSIGELVSTMTEKLSQLIRNEIQLAKTELSAKAKHAGKGAGLLGGAALFGFFGFAGLVTTAILALALVMPAWLSALIVAVVLLIIAGVLALIGKNALQRGLPPTPRRTQDNLKLDVQAVKEGLSS